MSDYGQTGQQCANAANERKYLIYIILLVVVVDRLLLVHVFHTHIWVWKKIIYKQRERTENLVHFVNYLSQTHIYPPNTWTSSKREKQGGKLCR